MGFLNWLSRASNSEVTSPVWPTFKLIQDFMPFLVTRKFDEDPIKMKALSLRQGQIRSFSALKVGNSTIISPNLPDFELLQDWLSSVLKKI